MVYCSSIERISFKEWDDRKGFVLVTIDTEDDEKKTPYEFVDTPARRFINIHKDARDAVDPTAAILAEIAREDLAEAMDGYVAQHDHLASIKDDLIEAALALEAEYEAKQRAEE